MILVTTLGLCAPRAAQGQAWALPQAVSRDLSRVLNDLYPAKASTRQYLGHLQALSDGSMPQATARHATGQS